jgi:DNA-binding transcriptional LysR family regulator
VSKTLANLEGQFGVRLFDRARRRPVLTSQGQVLLAHARTVVGDVDLLKAQAKHLAGGLEPELSVVVEVMFPMTTLTAAVKAFHAAFPLTPLRLYVEALGAVIAPVVDGRCTLAISGEMGFVPAQFGQERLLEVPLVQVTSPQHPLARYGRPIPSSELAKHVQLVLTDRSTLSKGKDFGVLSPRTWRLADLGAKHAFLRAGLGWGGMPLELVKPDLASGALVRIVAADAPPNGFVLSMHAVYASESPPGIAARWFIDRLKQGSQSEVRKGAPQRRTRRR